VALDVGDLAEAPEGLRVTIRRSKTDQEGAGQEIAIPRGARLRPVDALGAWLDAAGISGGPLFRRVSRTGRALPYRLTDSAVAVIVKDYARRAGLRAGDFAGHSLRAGFLTSGAEGGASVFKLMEVSRHRSVDVLAGYVRRADLFKDHAGRGFL
jgi:integrase